MTVVLNATNFVSEIKKMDNRARLKLRTEELINLIIQLPDADEHSAKLDEIFSTVTQLQNSVISNTQDIAKLKEDNAALQETNTGMYLQIETLREDNSSLKSQVEGLEKYNRINNIEIVGLAKKPAANETVEEMILECLNGMEDPDRDLEDENADVPNFTAADIDVCHELPKFKAGEHSHVVRFISRKSKTLAINLKKANRDYKFRMKDIYVNEHLTSRAKTLFSLAKERAKVLNYKFLWTRNGKILVRKTEESDVIEIDSEEKIINLS